MSENYKKDHGFYGHMTPESVEPNRKSVTIHGLGTNLRESLCPPGECYGVEDARKEMAYGGVNFPKDKQMGTGQY